MSLIRKHGAVLQAWACLDLVKYDDQCFIEIFSSRKHSRKSRIRRKNYTQSYPSQTGCHILVNIALIFYALMRYRVPTSTWFCCFGEKRPFKNLLWHDLSDKRFTCPCEVWRKSV